MNKSRLTIKKCLGSSINTQWANEQKKANYPTNDRLLIITKLILFQAIVQKHDVH